MSADDPELRRMLALYKQERAPEASVQERVWGAVTAEMAASGGAPDSSEPSEPPASPAPQAWTPPWIGKAFVVAALIAVGGAAWMSWPSNPAAPSAVAPARTLPASAGVGTKIATTTATTATATTTTTTTNTPTLERTPPPAAATAPSLPAEPRPARDARVPASTLALELALLTKAQAAIDAGDHASALRTLRRHAERFPTGALAEERDAASVEALCELGRAREARSAAEAFRAHFPDSPRVARVSKLCAREQAP